MRPALLAAVSLSCAAFADPMVQTWVRGDSRKPVVDLAKAPQTEASRKDAQTGATQTFRGVTLEALIREAAPAPALDLVVLHFQNGMAVPLPFRDEATLKALDPLVALAVKTKDGWVSAFPPLAKKDSGARDTRPITFEGNKLVVASLAHPYQPKAADEASPWQHVDSLTGLEFAVASAWDAQFAAGDAAPLKEGQRVFLSRCQFCHGVKRVGASYGWDFLDPLPITGHRTAKSLALHVRSREGDAPEKGLMMPALRDVTEAQVAAVWKWVEALSKKGPRPYQP
jgi:mono/diheme cytochrome c family protein